jgi:hypothetical protein
VPAGLTRSALVAGTAAFAAALGGTYVATAGGGEPAANDPIGSRAVPLDLPVYAAVPTKAELGPAEPVPALAHEAVTALPAVSAPAPPPAPDPPPAPPPVDFDDSG